MSGINAGNALDAGASATTKTSDFSDAIHEDVSSDLRREAGPGGVKKPWNPSVTSGEAARTGMLDQLGGTPKTLGADGSTTTKSSLEAGASAATKATEFTEGIHEDASRGIESARGGVSGSLFSNSQTNGPASGLLDSMKGSGSSNSSSDPAVLPGQKGGSLTGNHSILDSVKEKVSGVFGGKNSTESTMAAGASSATKDTDLTDGIHEEGTNAIESVAGATSRK